MIETAEIEGGVESEGITCVRMANPYLKSVDLKNMNGA